MTEYQRQLETLGLPPTAALTDITRRYHKLAKEIHPDRNPEREATAKFQSLHSAYLYLKKNHAKERAAAPAADEFLHREDGSAFVYDFGKRQMFSPFFVFSSTMAFFLFVCLVWSAQENPRAPKETFNATYDRFLKRSQVQAPPPPAMAQAEAKPVFQERNSKLDAYIYSRIDSHWNIFYRCLAAGPKKQLHSGRVDFQILITDTKISSIESLEGVTANPHTSSCLRKMLSGIEFPNLITNYRMVLPIELVVERPTLSLNTSR